MEPRLQRKRSSTYGVQSTDLGQGIACQVTAINGRGSGMATSNSLQVQPVAIVQPIVRPKVECKKGFKKKKVHGKDKCVKVKKPKKHGHR